MFLGSFIINQIRLFSYEVLSVVCLTALHHHCEGPDFHEVYLWLFFEHIEKLFMNIFVCHRCIFCRY